MGDEPMDWTMIDATRHDDTMMRTIIIAGPRQVAILETPLNEQGCADQALIAAAPDLLDALQSVLASVPFPSYRGDGELEECEQRVRAAIAKATE
jgi:hypothetical protein